MNSAIQSSGESVSVAEKVLFKFQDLEITRNTLVIRFFEEKTVIPLKEIAVVRFEVVFARSDFCQEVLVSCINGRP